MLVWALSLLTTQLISCSLTPKDRLYGIRSLINFGSRYDPAVIQCSTSMSLSLRLALKLFRGEPAISEFDWNFSAIHSSSPPFSTDVCSDLHEVLPSLHPGHG